MNSLHYQFVPYQYGPFSVTLYHELEKLKEDGWISADKGRKIVLNTIYDDNIDFNVKSAIGYLWKKYGKMSSGQLLDYVNNRYPWYAQKSIRSQKTSVFRPQCKPAVYTAGYEGFQVDGFLNLLIKSGIECVLDVRKNPISRRYGFHKSTLSRLCQKLGLEYIHYSEFGIPSKWRVGLEV